MELLEGFNANPEELATDLGGLQLHDKSHGTHYYISPTDDLLAMDIDDPGLPNTASPMTKMLIGFTNTMTPELSVPPLRARFRDHKIPGAPEELIGEAAFFTPDEFRSTDHHISGEFDESGQFLGAVTIYGQNPIRHVIPWRQPGGGPTQCGPFKISLGVLQGRSSESRLPTDEWAPMDKKLDRIGGLYIYRDGIRVLPYGDTDYDYLDMEKNRSKSAYYYYFSYRRIIGAVEISRSKNPNLSEKAGREGFRENKAYRQFRDILKNFFVQLAADFFRRGGEHSAAFEHGRSDLKLAEAAKREREHQLRMKRAEFERALNAAFERFERGEPGEQIERILDILDAGIRQAARESDPNLRIIKARSSETEARVALDNLRRSFSVTRPSGLALSTPLRRDWDAYRADTVRLEESILAALERAEQILAQVEAYAQDRRLRAETRLEEAAERARSHFKAAASSTTSEAEEAARRVSSLIRELHDQLEETIGHATHDVASLAFDQLSAARVAEIASNAESGLVDTAESVVRTLESLRQELAGVRWTRDDSGQVITSLDLAEVAEQELIGLQEQAELDLELTQLGMAVEVINHEFEATVKSIRSSLRQLRTWSDLNPDLLGLYQTLRANFDHLDSYLSLFTPLHRRLYRTQIDVRGADILKFLRDLFEERLRKDRISLDASPAFSSATLHGYPSTFYPVFVNLIDNAIFWLKDEREPRQVLLDADAHGLLVSDSGPGVDRRDKESVFELGFTRKPQGRGLGLYISREVLQREKYSIELEETGPLKGATFRIRPAASSE